MGLDSFWRHPSNTPEGTVIPDPVFDPPLRLCGGMLSGNGQGSFRGKVYAPLIEDVTGVSLYTEVIDAATVRRMAALLDGPLGAGVELDADEAADLVRMFRAYGDAGFELCGWW